jgi:hypothetical protein
MSSPGIRSSEELNGRLQVIAHVAAESRAASAAEDRKASPPRDPRQLTIGQVLFLVILWAFGAAAWRLVW